MVALLHDENRHRNVLCDHCNYPDFNKNEHMLNLKKKKKKHSNKE